MARFGELLAELRNDRGMTQAELAEILHVTTGTISNYENCIHYPDIEKLINLADFFDVTTDYLLGRCTSNLSPDVLETKIYAEKTAGSLIQDISNLSPERRRALGIVLKDMKLGTLVGDYGDKKA